MELNVMLMFVTVITFATKSWLVVLSVILVKYVGDPKENFDCPHPNPHPQ